MPEKGRKDTIGDVMIGALRANLHDMQVAVKEENVEEAARALQRVSGILNDGERLGKMGIEPDSPLEEALAALHVNITDHGEADLSRIREIGEKWGAGDGVGGDGAIDN